MECYITLTESKLVDGGNILEGLNHVADERLPRPTAASI